MKQYERLSACLSQVRRSWLSRSEQLQLEILLIEAKLLLLNDVIRAEVEDDPDSEDQFDSLYALVVDICDGKVKPAGFDRVMQFLTETVMELKCRREAGLPEPQWANTDPGSPTPQMSGTGKK